MAIRIEKSVSYGQIASTGVIFAGMIGAFVWAQADIRSLGEHQKRIDSDLVAIRQEAAAREARIRGVEIAQASQSSDLRSIQIGISRIEAQLEKLQPRP
ncbi:hypothetical protein SAMN05421774_1333 [Gemmobacter megaterium]|uniref:Uncharacterized protein n=1 Tax=Gemmobacter megaterium TaxID=1086013 RepID=A0A1N7QT96_9RHOB|nr:hypothetical protein [Gemmobacter megaterium]GGE29498.1 hypothetical protein GCM10011345_39480 [Gemmobacter megaterium]SIT26101.1 hypothetical protein SAMN05421774_1333 [Gemmobacter megaterium]